MCSMGKASGKGIWELLGAQPPEKTTVAELQDKLLQHRRKPIQVTLAAGSSPFCVGKQQPWRSSPTNSSFNVKPKPIVPFEAARSVLRDARAAKERMTVKPQSLLTNSRDNIRPRRSIDIARSNNEAYELGRADPHHFVRRKLFPTLSHHTSLLSNTTTLANSRQSTQSNHMLGPSDKPNRLVRALRDTTVQKNSLGRLTKKVDIALATSAEGMLLEETAVDELPCMETSQPTNTTSKRPSVRVLQSTGPLDDQSSRNLELDRHSGSPTPSYSISRWDSNSELNKQHATRKKSQFHRRRDEEEEYMSPKKENIGSINQIEETPFLLGSLATVDREAEGSKEWSPIVPSLTKNHRNRVKPPPLRESSAAARSARKRNIEQIAISEAAASFARKKRSTMMDADGSDFENSSTYQIRSSYVLDGSDLIRECLLEHNEEAAVRELKLNRIRCFLERPSSRRKALREELLQSLRREISKKQQRHLQVNSESHSFDEQFLRELMLMLKNEESVDEVVRIQMETGKEMSEGTSVYHRKSSPPNQRNSRSPPKEDPYVTHSIYATIQKCFRSGAISRVDPHRGLADELEQLALVDQSTLYCITTQSDVSEDKYLALPAGSQCFGYSSELKQLLRRVKKVYPHFWTRLLKLQNAPSIF